MASIPCPPGVTVLLGGVRSGKSTMAVQMAESFPGSVHMVPTAEALDDDMTVRIERHRAERPGHWTLDEQPRQLERALSAAPVDALVIVDCLTVWTSNLLLDGMDEGAVTQMAGRAAQVASGRRSPTVFVTNEVGAGVVPAHELGRQFRDLLGAVNQRFVEVADQAALVVAGRVLPLRTADELWS